MRKLVLKRDKRGVAGLEILKAVIVAVFIIGILIMVFAIMGSKLKTTTEETSSGIIYNETIEGDNATGDTVAQSQLALRGFSMNTNVDCYKAINGTLIPDANITATSAGLVKCIGDNKTKPHYCSMDWNCTYRYDYISEYQASLIINTTTKELAGVPNWFGIIIVITVMVVLIFLVALIIRAVRGTGVEGA